MEYANAEGLKRLWMDYESGHLNETAERCLLTDEVTENPQTKDIRVKTIVKGGGYFARRKLFELTKPRKGVASPGKSWSPSQPFFEKSDLVFLWESSLEKLIT